MGNINKVILVGNATRDPEFKSLSGDNSVAKLGLALNRKFKKRDGEKGEEVCFVDCEAWGRTAEVLSQYVKKGDPVGITGRLKLDQWENKQGEKQSKIKVYIEELTLLGSGGKRDNGTPPARRNTQSKPASGAPAYDPDDIPF